MRLIKITVRDTNFTVAGNICIKDRNTIPSLNLILVNFVNDFELVWKTLRMLS